MVERDWVQGMPWRLMGFGSAFIASLFAWHFQRHQHHGHQVSDPQIAVPDFARAAPLAPPPVIAQPAVSPRTTKPRPRPETAATEIALDVRTNNVAIEEEQTFIAASAPPPQHVVVVVQQAPEPQQLPIHGRARGVVPGHWYVPPRRIPPRQVTPRPGGLRPRAGTPRRNSARRLGRPVRSRGAAGGVGRPRGRRPSGSRMR